MERIRERLEQLHRWFECLVHVTAGYRVLLAAGLVLPSLAAWLQHPEFGVLNAVIHTSPLTLALALPVAFMRWTNFKARLFVAYAIVGVMALGAAAVINHSVGWYAPIVSHWQQGKWPEVTSFVLRAYWQFYTPIPFLLSLACGTAVGYGFGSLAAKISNELADSPTQVDSFAASRVERMALERQKLEQRLKLGLISEPEKLQRLGELEEFERQFDLWREHEQAARNKAT